MKCLACPCLPEEVDFLIATPDASLAPSLLAVDEEATTHESMIGPGDVFTAALYEDTDEGLIALGLEGSVQVFDIADGMLQFVREYDPVTDSTEPIKPFHPTLVHTFPHGDVFLSRVREWMRTLADGGSLFYSDQEDLGTPPKAATVQAADTKIGCATKTCHTSCGDGEIGCSCQPDATFGGETRSARRAIQGVFCKRCLRAAGCFRMCSAASFGQFSRRRGRHKRVDRCAEGDVPDRASPSTQRSAASCRCPYCSSGRDLKGERRRCRAWWVQLGGGVDVAKHGLDIFGRSPCSAVPRQHWRAEHDGLFLADCRDQRRVEEGKDAGRTGSSLRRVLSPVDAADAQASSPREASPSISQRTAVSLHACLFGEAGGISDSTGNRPGDVDAWPCGRCYQCGGLDGSARTSGFDSCGNRAVCCGPRRLEFGFSACCSLQATHSDVSRQDGGFLAPRETFCSPMSSQLGCDHFGIFEDMETLSTKKSEIAPKGKAASPGAAGPSSTSETPSPKRKTRYPKKVKPAQEGS